MITIQDLIDERHRQNITQKTVAEEIGVSKRTMCMYEKGNWDISLANINKYAELLGLDTMISNKKDGDLRLKYASMSAELEEIENKLFNK